MVLKLIEYAWNGSKYVSGGTLAIDPSPNSIEKLVKAEWRIRHQGLYAIYPRSKYRYRKTIEFTLKGGCTPDKRKEIEFYAARYSKFKVDNDTWSKVVSPEYYSDRNTNPADHPYDPDATPQTLYVVFEEVEFTLEEAKDWCTYSIKLKVVNIEGISEGGIV